MTKRLRNYIVYAAAIVIFLATAGYHLLFGYITTHQIGERLTVISRQNLFSVIGANVVLYNDPVAALVIDTQLAPVAAATKAKIDSLAMGAIKTVIVTHWHPDHSGGIATYAASTVYTHPNVARVLSAPHEGFGLTKPGSHHAFSRRDADAMPNASVDDELELQLADSTIRVVHYPKAHTDGDLVVFFPHDNVVVLGDLVWPNAFPFIDVHNGGSVRGLEAALADILQRSDHPGDTSRYIPGHGSPLSRGEMQLYLEMLRSTRLWVEQMADQGRTLAQIQATPPPTTWTAWANDLVPSTTWVEMVYNSGR